MNRRRPSNKDDINESFDMHRCASNIDEVDDIEVILAPNFDSDNPLEVLGCSSEADPEELDRAYRDLSRKYHPKNTLQHHSNNDDDDSKARNQNRRNIFIFQKISQAYARATGKEEVPTTQEAAQRAYENMFGKYRELYYNEGGLIGIPYSVDLKELLEESRNVRDALSLPLCRFGDFKLQLVFFRTWLIKKEMNFWLCLAEILLTWTVIAFCVLAFFLDKDSGIWPVMSDNEGQILDVAGGVALMFAQFILCFWYGFCRYPAGSGDYCEWLYPRRREDNERIVVDEDMQDIRRVCSRYMHNDNAKRFNPLIVWMCLPVVAVEQLMACFTASIASVFCFMSHDEETRSYGQHLSKSIAGLMVVMGYYLLWMYGNSYCKLAGTTALLLSQNLYNAILFEKGVFEFLQAFVFGDFALFTLQEKLRRTKICNNPAGQKHEDNLKDRTLSMDEDERTGDGSATARKLDVETGRAQEQVFASGAVRGIERSTVTGSTEEAAVLAAAKMAAMGETTIYGKDLSFKSSSKTRSFSSFNPMALLKNVTYPKNRETVSTPAVLRDRDDNDNVSLDLSYIDHGKIETFVGENTGNDGSENLSDEHDDDNYETDDDDDDDHYDDRMDGLNAQDILKDLEDGESSNSDDISESNNMLSVYKATKRRLEEAFYASTRIRVVGDANSDHSNDRRNNQANVRSSSQPSRVRTNDSYDFTFDQDDESDVQRPGHVLPPIVRVFDYDEQDTGEAHDVEVDDNGQILGEPPVVRVQKRKTEVSPGRPGRRTGKSVWNFSRWGEGGKKSDSPPLEHVFTNGINDPLSFDEELTRNGTWDDSIAKGVSRKKTKPKKVHDPPVSFDNDLCCSEDFLP